MIFLIACLVSMGICGYFWYKANKKGESMPLSAMGVLISAILTFFVILILIISPYGVRQGIAEYHGAKQTIENARATDITDIERAALAQKIVEINQWLARVKYQNSIFLIDDFIPDEVDDLEPLI